MTGLLLMLYCVIEADYMYVCAWKKVLFVAETCGCKKDFAIRLKNESSKKDRHFLTFDF